MPAVRVDQSERQEEEEDEPERGFRVNPCTPSRVCRDSVIAGRCSSRQDATQPQRPTAMSEAPTQTARKRKSSRLAPEPDGVGGDDQAQNPGQTPALVGECWKQESRDRQPDREQNHEQDESRRRWRPGSHWLPPHSIERRRRRGFRRRGRRAGVWARSGSRAGVQGRCRAQDITASYVGARERRCSLVDGDARVVVIDERLVGLRDRRWRRCRSRESARTPRRPRIRERRPRAGRSTVPGPGSATGRRASPTRPAARTERCSRRG